MRTLLSLVHFCVGGVGTVLVRQGVPGDQTRQPRETRTSLFAIVGRGCGNRCAILAAGPALQLIQD